MNDNLTAVLKSITVIFSIALLGAALIGGATTCASAPRANCYTCVERCAPFKVAACEPSWSHLAPIYCSCDPFTRLDDGPVIGPAKGRP